MAERTYDRMAPIYERLTDLYSFGCVPRAKREQLTHIRPGMRVLYVGLGPGSAALAAAQIGADVAGIDLSARMIDIASKRFAVAGQQADLRCDDLFAFQPDKPYDAVVANFLLDCFDDQRRPSVVDRLRGFLVAGGTLLITDTGRPRGSRVAKAWWYGYQGVAYSTTWVQGITPWLPIMDLGAYLNDAGFTVEDNTLFRPWRRGPALFESIVGIKA